jgi:beta-phosphoglucomutase family hydrolase
VRADGAFIFDMDGTLVDNMSFHERTWLDLLAGCGVAVTAEEFHRRASGRTNPDILREFLGDRIAAEEVADWTERKEALYRDSYRPHLRAIDGLEHFLAAAHRLGVPLAVATSGTPGNVEFVLEGLGFGPLFATVVTGDEVTRGKPDPEMFLTAAARLGVEPGNCLVFEDSRAGVEAGLRAGMRVVVIETTPGIREMEGQPGVVDVVPDFTGLDPRTLLHRSDRAHGTGNLSRERGTLR